MTSIALICAHLPGRNTGMATVDLAGWQLLHREFPDATINAYALERGGRPVYSAEELPIPYRPLPEHAAEAFAADVIIFWGDFQHAPGHWRYDVFPRLVRDGLARTEDEARDLVYRMHMLEGATEATRRRSIIFGGTIITNTIAENSDTRYAAALHRLVTEARGIYFRDPISAAHVARLRPGAATLGTDCALLLEDGGERGGPSLSSGRIGVHFGRSRLVIGLLAFARLIARQAGLKPDWLPWFRARPRTALQAKALGFTAARSNASPDDTLAELRRCDAIVTDTYHLAVNAWRLGIPAVCIGFGAERSDSTLNSKKKEIFYAMHGANDFYVFRENLRTPAAMAGEASRVAALLKARAHEPVVDAVREQAAVARTLLVDSVRGALAEAR
jgi:hypothetical protein